MTNSPTERKDKFCSLCFKRLPIAEFGVDRARSDGRRSACKKCRNKAERQRRQADPSSAEKFLAYRNANLDRVRQNDRAYRARHREKIRARQQARRAKERQETTPGSGE